MLRLNTSPSLSRFTTHSEGVKLLTCLLAKLRSVLNSLDGGKIAEKANVLGNSKNTGLIRSASNFKSQGLTSGISPLNSVCLNKISIALSGRSYSTQKSTSIKVERSELLSLSTYNLIDNNPALIAEEVELKQKKLVKLAEKYGFNSIKVHKFQLLLVRSLAFRLQAVNLMKSKPGSQTPGIDNEIFYKSDIKKSYEALVEYLRDITYHPNKYYPSPRVWIPKPGKSEKRPLGIPTVKDRALQTLINLVLMPLVEATSDIDSYGFRPYRDCKMAVSAVRMQLKSLDLVTQEKSMKKRFGKTGLAAYTQLNEDKWILDADIKGFFDNISHEWLLTNLFLHPKLKSFVEK